MSPFKTVVTILVVVLHIIHVDNLSLVFTKHRRSTVMEEDTISEDEQVTTTLNYENQRDEPQGRAPCKCTDALQNCNVITNPVTCCMVAPIMNMSCQKSCLFCYDMQSPMPGGMPGMPLPSAIPGQNQPVVYQNPCNPQMPPSIMTECPELQNPTFPNPGGSNNNPFPNPGTNNNNNNNNNNNQQISQAINFPPNNPQG